MESTRQIESKSLKKGSEKSCVPGTEKEETVH
jgi:hypothetical protein